MTNETNYGDAATINARIRTMTFHDLAGCDRVVKATVQQLADLRKTPVQTADIAEQIAAQEAWQAAAINSRRDILATEMRRGTQSTTNLNVA
jgi:hypothetical protein